MGLPCTMAAQPLGQSDGHDLFPHHLGTALGAIHLVAGHTHLMWHLMSAVGADAVAAGPRTGLGATHTASTSAASQATSSTTATPSTE